MNYLKLVSIIFFIVLLNSCENCDLADCPSGTFISFVLLEDGNNILLQEDPPIVSIVEQSGLGGGVFRVSPESSLNVFFNASADFILTIGEKTYSMTTTGAVSNDTCCSIYEVNEIFLDSTLICNSGTCREEIVINI